jgi:hypothetical protein
MSTEGEFILCACKLGVHWFLKGNRSTESVDELVSVSIVKAMYAAKKFDPLRSNGHDKFSFIAYCVSVYLSGYHRRLGTHRKRFVTLAGCHESVATVQPETPDVDTARCKLQREVTEVAERLSSGGTVTGRITSQSRKQWEIRQLTVGRLRRSLDPLGVRCNLQRPKPNITTTQPPLSHEQRIAFIQRARNARNG